MSLHSIYPHNKGQGLEMETSGVHKALKCLNEDCKCNPVE